MENSLVVLLLLQLDMVPDIVKSSTTKVDQMDDAMLEREIVSLIF